MNEIYTRAEPEVSLMTAIIIGFAALLNDPSNAVASLNGSEWISPHGGRRLEHAGDHNWMALKWLELEDRLKREGWVVIGERRIEQP